MAELLIALFSGLVGALLTLLGAGLTRAWQEHQKELELKTELVGDLSKSIVGIVKAVQRIHEHEPLVPHPEGISSEIRKWEVSRAILGAKLEAYFPGTWMSCRWRKYQDVMCGFYKLELGDKGKERESDDRKELLGFLAPHKPLESWDQVHEAIMDAKSRFIRQVLQTPIRPLRSSWWSKRRLKRKWWVKETSSEEKCRPKNGDPGRPPELAFDYRERRWIGRLFPR